MLPKRMTIYSDTELDGFDELKSEFKDQLYKHIVETRKPLCLSFLLIKNMAIWLIRLIGSSI